MKKIPLTQGKFALVDDEDYEYLIQWKWHCMVGKWTSYAARKQYLGIVNKKIKLKTIWMHRVINKTPSHLLTDHKDGNGLNNQKFNLRDATNSQNQFNQKKQTRKTLSKYKGVTFAKRRNRWQAQIGGKAHKKNIGYFKTELQAAKAYNKAVRILRGKYAKVNIL